MLAALERPPDTEKPLGAWLSRVARNLSIKLRLSEARRWKRERTVALPEQAPSTDQVIEREEARRRVVKAVLRLKEPYRSTVLLRYYEDLPLKLVAESQDVPIETVRTRLRRGIDQLRTMLDEHYAGGRKAWCLAIAPLAGLHLSSLAKKTASGLAISTKVKIGTAAIVLPGVAFILYQALVWINETSSQPPLEIPTVQARPTNVQIPPEPAQLKEEDSVATQVKERDRSFEEKIRPDVEEERVPVKTSSKKKDKVPAFKNRDKALGNHDESPPFNMVRVPAGKVRMGMSVEEAMELADGEIGVLNSLLRSVPEHEVSVDEFFCDRYEVTNAQWKAYLDHTGQEPSEDLVKYAWNKNTSYPKREADLPIRNVTLREAKAFARWCGKRIPLEEEWHRAAAGDDGRIYTWGDKWYDGKLCTHRRNKLVPVGSYKKAKSPFGIYDMTGGVWEWTATRFNSFPGFNVPVVKYARNKPAVNPGFNEWMYVIKGGHYLQGELANRLDIREPCMPKNSLDSLGFRCVKDTKPGHTMLMYAQEDLAGSMISDLNLDLENLQYTEHTVLSDRKPRVIIGFDYELMCPFVKNQAMMDKIHNSPDLPWALGILSMNRSLEVVELPPGSYILAYRFKGKSRTEKTEEIKKDKVAKNTDENEREERDPVASTEEDIPYPTNKDLIVFMNKNNKIVGYLGVEDLNEKFGLDLPEGPGR
jgi:RNA polymerase sigma factor (sigma-70 family)